MTELTTWKKEYGRLREYIAAHPEIVIKKNEISIPQPFREEFYRIFDDIRRAVAVNHLDALPVNARTLSERYIQVEKEAAELLGVEKFDMPVDLDVFLRNPEEGLIRAVYNRLFDLIQEKIDDEEFERLARESTLSYVAELFRFGYERWVGLELIKLLEPEEAFFVSLDEELKPCFGELETVSFGAQCHHPTMRIPEFVVRSRRFDSLVAVKMSVAVEIDEYLVLTRPLRPPKRRTGDTSLALDTRAVLLSFIKDESKIPVYADIFEGNRTPPDWMIEFVNINMQGCIEEAFDRIRRHKEIMNPKFGCALISPLDDLDVAVEMIPENVRLVALGFDTSKLETEFERLSA